MTRMSHAEYIAPCDEFQLIALVELANERLKEIREAGYVKLWVVSDDFMHFAWFEQSEYPAALAYLSQTGLDLQAKGRPTQLEVRLKKFRPEEAAQLVQDTRAELAQSAKPATAKTGTSQ